MNVGVELFDFQLRCDEVEKLVKSCGVQDLLMLGNLSEELLEPCPSLFQFLIGLADEEGRVLFFGELGDEPWKILL